MATRYIGHPMKSSAGQFFDQADTDATEERLTNAAGWPREEFGSSRHTMALKSRSGSGFVRTGTFALDTSS